ncbi:CopM family metallochaperone [Roseivivax isoporae]|uniref:DUF305 domain-containing protein n=1 Tax=Roseivivax isoporae LMG 25204 TaxID=1449351 RepID=X7F3T3_9RHOB|nr:DUF305 domain-containing protein [Roseivivax isoporae]ETX26719.1 hypothetical protein RISW2_20520 [Roseivivax isoporae LMG 25204]
MRTVTGKILSAAALTIVLAGGIAGASAANEHGHGHGKMPHDEMMDHGGMMQHGGTAEKEADEHGSHAAGQDRADEPASTAAYRAANLAMHSAMDIEFTGDADIDFARGMIGHHQGAIDMARIVLDHGSDPDLRQLAEDIIAAQEAEIAFLEAWIADHADE